MCDDRPLPEHGRRDCRSIPCYGIPARPEFRSMSSGERLPKREPVPADREKRSTSASSMAALLLAVGLREVREGHVEVRRKRSDSPRFDWLVDVSEGDAGF